MKLYLPILFLCAVTSACKESQKNEVYNENNTTVVNGVVYNIDEKPINGLYKVYYPDGTVKMEIFSKNGKPDGNGKFYTEKGTLYYEGNFKQGLPDGTMLNYYKDGSVHNEMLYKDGILHGVQKAYDKEGKLIAEVTYDEGKAIEGFTVVNGEKVPITPEELAKMQ